MRIADEPAKNMYSISIISRLCAEFAACRTPECRKAKCDLLVWRHREELPAIREILERSGQAEELRLFDEMIAEYKELPAWPERVHYDYSKRKR